MAKMGFYFSTEPAKLTWRMGPGRMRDGMQGHVAAPWKPMRGGGADTWQDHPSSCGRLGGATLHCEGLCSTYCFKSQDTWHRMAGWM